MYERFYRLRERPFALTPDPDYLYPSRVHREALNYLRYGIETHAGFVVITGAIGSGKTTLLQTLLRGLDDRTTVARVMNTLLDPRELLESAMIDLGLDPAGKSKPAMLKQFGEFLVAEREAGRLVLLVIDEAQNLALPALEEIRMLSNLETEKSKLLQIILIGQPDLRDKLARPELEQLKQRITVSYHLEPLDAEETARYINHRLARASIGAPIEFSGAVTSRIHARSGGVPRVINVIADAALVFGYGEEKPEIDVALVDDVIRDLDQTGVLGAQPEPEHHASIVPAEPAPVAAATDARIRAIEERERALREREQEMASRERELGEQRRVLAEQYRILRTRPADAPAQPPAAPSAFQAQISQRAVWPPTSHTAQAMAARPAGQAAKIPPRPAAPAGFVTYQPKRRSFWRRVKQALRGTPDAVLEDSL